MAISPQFRHTAAATGNSNSFCEFVVMTIIKFKLSTISPMRPVTFGWRTFRKEADDDEWIISHVNLTTKSPMHRRPNEVNTVELKCKRKVMTNLHAGAQLKRKKKKKIERTTKICPLRTMSTCEIEIITPRVGEKAFTLHFPYTFVHVSRNRNLAADNCTNTSFSSLQVRLVLHWLSLDFI